MSAVAAVAGIAGVTMKVSSQSAMAKTAQISLKAGASRDWTQREDVKAMQKLKVKYSEMSNDQIQSLFEKFQKKNTKNALKIIPKFDKIT